MARKPSDVKKAFDNLEKTSRRAKKALDKFDDAARSNLGKFRKEKGLTQGALAKSAGVSFRTMQDYEQKNKDINNARAITLYRLSQVLGCTIEDLLELTEEQTPEN